ncbi:MAG: DUF4258 domain-containing protein [Candidatus Diapherotrites archaeon]|nr:DUF4258 domain-containing protein [Candidatus Diapherotrites archaeon]
MVYAKIRITKHAMERMEKYGISEALVIETLKRPKVLIEGYAGRKIAQRKLNSYVLRVVFEKKRNEIVVITVYKARRERYEI